jgi:hypothetical protein
MQEQFLHYVWNTRSFDQKDLLTTENQTITIEYPGHHNEDAGPDFLEAKIKIDGVMWAGSIEMHLKSSYWHQHRHSQDPAYENVILHVVWEDDQAITYPEGNAIPCLVLPTYVDPTLLDRYDTLLHQIGDIPCQYAIPGVLPIIQRGMLEKAAVERLHAKASEVIGLVNHLNQDWEETCYRLTLAAFGMKVNKKSMERLAETLPFKWIKKHTDRPIMIESLLFGQAGLLDQKEEAYCQELTQHFEFLRHKYNLASSLHRPQWKFSRLRPANFPTIRLAQAAAFFAQHPLLFDNILHMDELKPVSQLFRVETNEYWQHHYDFGKPFAKSGSTKIGLSMVHHLIINVFAPVLVAASRYFDKPEYLDKAMTWLENVPAESNKITRKFGSVGIEPSHSLDSQGCLSLYYEYCLKKNCLRCNIGASILRQ